jgi:pyruvate/2-oxoglutarate dehydrogenase complex dihydrolipoamide dehydrogenase (E3) component
MILKTEDAIEKSIIADKVLYAVGRPPLVDALKLENTNVKIEKGAIKVDDF